MIEKNFPNLFIIGVAKSGTTSLFQYLSQHPDIFPGKRKETRYFTAYNFNRLPISQFFQNQFVIERENFIDYFEDHLNEKYIMDAPIFAIYFKEALNKIIAESPKAKAILMLRDPVQRVFSHYSMLVNQGFIKIPFSKFIKNPISIEGMNLIDLGLYSQYVTNAIEIFGKDNIMVILYNDFAKHTQKVLSNIYKFLQIEDGYKNDLSIRHKESYGTIKWPRLSNFYNKIFPIWSIIKKIRSKFIYKLRKIIQSLIFSKNEMIKPDTKEFLYKYYLEDINKLERIIGRELDDWKHD